MGTQIVSFHCVLKDKLGQFISASYNHNVINQLEGDSETLKGLVAGIQNVAVGEKRQFLVPADQAYGLYDPNLVIEIPRQEIVRGQKLKVGNEVLTDLGSKGRTRMFRVITAGQDTVVLDGNHPLAGQDLYFEVEITAAREATDADFEDEPVAITPMAGHRPGLLH